MGLLDTKIGMQRPMTIHRLEMHVLVYIHYFNKATTKIVWFYLTCCRTCWASTAKAAIFTYTIRAILKFFTQFSSRCKQRHLKSIFVMDACLFYVVARRNTTGGAGRTTSREGANIHIFVFSLINFFLNRLFLQFVKRIMNTCPSIIVLPAPLTGA